MSVNQQLHTLIDKVDEKEYTFLLHLLMKLIPNDEILPDEMIAFDRAEISYANGDVVNHADIDWD